MDTLNTYLKKVALITAISTQAYSSSFGAEPPHQVQTLIAKRQEAINRIDKAFTDELDKIKIRFTKAGDLENANLVSKLITQTKETNTNNDSSLYSDAPTTIKNKVVGKWMIYDTKHPKVWSGIITITEGLTYSSQGSIGIDGFDKGSVTFQKEKNKMTLGPYEFIYPIYLPVKFSQRIGGQELWNGLNNSLSQLTSGHPEQGASYHPLPTVKLLWSLSILIPT